VTFVPGNGFENVVVQIEEGALVAIPTEYALQFYEIAGWKKDAEETYYDFNTPVTSSFTLTATWNISLPWVGTGTEIDPFLISDAFLLDAVLDLPVEFSTGNYFRITADISYNIDASLNTSNFNGFLDGGDFILTLTGNGALFETLSAQAQVTNMRVFPTLASDNYAYLASVARYNYGMISYVTVGDGLTSTIISTAGTVNDYANIALGGAGGIVGINKDTGIILMCTNKATVQARIGGGGIASDNQGYISLCTNEGFVGATSTTVSSTTGSLTPTYSFAGGITGINEAVIERCINSNNVFAQRNAKTAASNGNENLGGIAGLNTSNGAIILSINSGRIHGDQYIGGLAGTSEGIINYSYNVGDYGGRFNLGGIAGKTIATSTVNRCYSTTNYNSTSSTNSYKFSDAQAAGTYWAVSEFATSCVYSDISMDSTGLLHRDGAGPVTGEGNVPMSAIPTGNFLSVLGNEFYVYNSITAIHNQLRWNAPETTYFTITFVPGEGLENVEIEVQDGYSFSAPEFLRDYYTISGWTKTGESTFYDFSTPVTSEFTLTATWVESLALAGTGANEDPYLIPDADTFNYVRDLPETLTTGKYFQLTSSIELATTSVDNVSTFNGALNGDNYIISTVGDGPIFSAISANAVISNLVILPTLTTTDAPYLASLARDNYGTIVNVVVGDGTIGTVVSTAGTVNDYGTITSGGAAGLVGINHSTGLLNNCVNKATVQARIGGGGLVSDNQGTIQLSVNQGLIGATTTTVSSTTGAAVPAYSFMGGIAGVNEATITQCINTNNVFAQRNAKTAVSNGNEVMGGIAGLNLSTGNINLSFNTGRIHGDQYVGGITGRSEGTIASCYNVGNYGGRFNLGGIAGKTIATSVVDYCYSTTNFDSTSSTNSYKFSDAQLTGTYWALSEFATNSVYSDISYSTTSPYPLRDGSAPATGTGNAAMSTIPSGDFTGVLGTVNFVYSASSTPTNRLVWYVNSLPA